MKAWAESATAQLDAKAKMLIKWLRENIRPGDRWSDDRVIIFTEYRATQNWLTTQANRADVRDYYVDVGIYGRSRPASKWLRWR